MAHIVIENRICEECPNDVLEQMEKDFPIFKTKREWPANHPIWVHYKTLCKKFEQKCFHVIACDGSPAITLCSKHLQQWVDRMQSPEAL
jgi:hypothetical protein